MPDTLRSFVGACPVPARHGLTLGELALLYVAHEELPVDLRVVACLGWRRGQTFAQTGLPWVLPSPNMPTLETAFVYPGACLVEATTLSEGRGTTRPFELVGAPWVDGFVLAEALTELELPGVSFRPHLFQPLASKHAGQVCGGVQLHVHARDSFMPLRTGLALLWQIRALWPGQWAWREAPYEFRADKPAIDLLSGTPMVRAALDAGVAFDKVYAAACGEDDSFATEREPFLLYE